jgi:hypothetical protein
MRTSLCPNRSATSVGSAPLLINKDAWEWRMSWILIFLIPDSSQYFSILRVIVMFGNGDTMPKMYRLLEKPSTLEQFSL